MAFIGYDELKKLLESCISPFNEDLFNKTQTSYELCLGDEVYITNSKNGKKERLNRNNSSVCIDPGQFALLLIKEDISIPLDKIALITLKFGIKIKGLINISGFHVDPGFKGKLIYSVYNAGTRSIVLERGHPYFSIWFSELRGTPPTGKTPYDGKFQGQKEIKPEYIEALKGELWNPVEITNKIKKTKNIYNRILFIAGIIVTTLITITLKLNWENAKTNEGYLNTLHNKEIDERIEQIITSEQVDSIISVKVSSHFDQKSKKEIVGTNDRN